MHFQGWMEPCQHAAAVRAFPCVSHCCACCPVLFPLGAVRAFLCFLSTFRAPQMTNRTSMPNVYIKGTSYGGCNDGPGVVPLHRDGKLLPLLKEAGAV